MHSAKGPTATPRGRSWLRLLLGVLKALALVAAAATVLSDPSNLWTTVPIGIAFVLLALSLVFELVSRVRRKREHAASERRRDDPYAPR